MVTSICFFDENWVINVKIRVEDVSGSDVVYNTLHLNERTTSLVGPSMPSTLFETEGRYS